MKSSRASSAMGGGGKKSKSARSKKGGKHVHQMHIRHSANGGYIAKHIKKDGGDDGEHTMPDISALTAHVQDNMATPPPGAQPMPQPGGGMPMPTEQPRGGM